MGMGRARHVFAIVAFGLGGLGLGCAAPATKPILGPTARAVVAEAGLSFEGRVDTGAEVSSIHAVDIERIDAATPRLRFTLENAEGERVTLERSVLDVAEVRSASGSERRYRVPLTLAIGGIEAEVRVTLRDRSAMRHRLLVGRDVLAGRFLVDVAPR